MIYELLNNPDLLSHVASLPSLTPLELELSDRLREALREIETLIREHAMKHASPS